MLPDHIDTYLKRYGAGPPLLPPPDDMPQLCITIPAHKETDLSATIDSIAECEVPVFTEVLVLINYPDNADDDQKNFHRDQLSSLKSGGYNKINLRFHFIKAVLPEKDAGVGLARKILMDEALRRLLPSGVIVTLDADCTVQSNYLNSIYTYFSHHPDAQGASIYFEHPLQERTDQTLAVAAYELHLRYYVEAQRYLNLPFAYHTVGSCMAVRPYTYAKAGGMNRRKAGEDFYFLQKIIPHGFGEINDTTVYPSGRKSDRVPFGTGRAVTDMLSGKKQALSYAPENIEMVGKLIDLALHNEKRPGEEDTIMSSMADYLNMEAELNRIRSISTTTLTFRRHFFRWFDGFRLMKALHFLRENNAPDVPVTDAASWLLETAHGLTSRNDVFYLLKQFRSLQRFTSVP